jgi:hypothetical protein
MASGLAGYLANLEARDRKEKRTKALIDECESFETWNVPRADFF